MFTGLVEETGLLKERQPESGGGARLLIQASRVLDGIALGDSIAVNGTCLTVVNWDHSLGTVAFDAVAETLERTTLKTLPLGRSVNLERALRVGDRLGGHYVTGHIDGPGVLKKKERSGNGVVFRFRTDKSLMRQISSKGSVSVDGISLTVVEAQDQEFSVWIVPHTLSATSLGDLQPGEQVNLETDILAKYVERTLSTHTGGGIGYDTLEKAGFLQ